MTADANNFADIAAFADVHHKQLQQIFPQHQTTPSHDTLTRAFAMLTHLPTNLPKSVQ